MIVQVKTPVDLTPHLVKNAGKPISQLEYSRKLVSELILELLSIFIF